MAADDVFFFSLLLYSEFQDKVIFTVQAPEIPRIQLFTLSGS